MNAGARVEVRLLPRVDGNMSASGLTQAEVGMGRSRFSGYYALLAGLVLVSLWLLGVGGGIAEPMPYPAPSSIPASRIPLSFLCLRAGADCLLQPEESSGGEMTARMRAGADYMNLLRIDEPRCSRLDLTVHASTPDAYWIHIDSGSITTHESIIAGTGVTSINVAIRTEFSLSARSTGDTVLHFSGSADCAT